MTTCCCLGKPFATQPCYANLEALYGVFLHSRPFLSYQGDTNFSTAMLIQRQCAAFILVVFAMAATIVVVMGVILITVAKNTT